MPEILRRAGEGTPMQTGAGHKGFLSEGVNQPVAAARPGGGEAQLPAGLTKPEYLPVVPYVSKQFVRYHGNHGAARCQAGILRRLIRTVGVAGNQNKFFTRSQLPYPGGKSSAGSSREPTRETAGRVSSERSPL